MKSQRILKTNKGDFSNTEKDVVLEPGVLKTSSTKQFFKECIRHNSHCRRERINTKVTMETLAHTPYFLSGPKFNFVFPSFTKTSQTWIDVMVTASQSEQKSGTSENCLGYYNVYKSIFKTRNLFSKSVTSMSTKDSILISLLQSERRKPKQIRIKVLTRSLLSKAPSNTTIDLEWTSIVNLSRDCSRKIIALPGMLRAVTLKALSFLRNYTINVYWTSDLFTKSSHQLNGQIFCHKDVMAKTQYNYCLNYTSAQNSYLFYWNFTHTSSAMSFHH